MEASDTARYLLVKLDDDKLEVAIELIKDIQEYDGVAAAMIVRRGSAYSTGTDSYVGEFYSTQEAIARMHNA